ARTAALAQVEEARAEAARNWAQHQLVMAELEHLVDVRLPAVVQELQGVRVHAPAGLRRPDAFDGSETAAYLEAVEDAVRVAGAAVRQRVEDSARAGVRVAAEEIQASLTRAQRDIDNAFDDQDDLASASGRGAASSQTLARVDHSVTLATHTVQRLRILTESWPGVQRANCTVAEIMESARGRIRHSEAVEYTYHAHTGEAVVEGLVVEPVIVALTELLDNATAYSGNVAATHVHRVATGMRITVEDQGLGMSPLQLEEAERALASGTTDVTGLAEPGKLGFLVIGRLVHAYGLRVGLSPSASGGVRADLLIPAERLVAEGSDQAPPAPAATAPHEPGHRRTRESAPVSGHPTPTGAGSADLEPARTAVPSAATGRTGEVAGLTAHGLPKRQPRRAVRRHAEPRLQDFSDPESFAEGFAQLRGVLAAGFGGEDNVNEG
ncbi:MAG TPA: hypothetical protein VLH10_16920, partial [Yinghuangia sp.]|nr:hypothetical protein [Yinghuangia sp.]